MSLNSNSDNDASRISRRVFLKSCVASGLFAGAASAVQTMRKSGNEAAQAGGNRPNIVLILADDLGAVDTSLGGSSFYPTPSLKRLAKRGVLPRGRA